MSTINDGGPAFPHKGYSGLPISGLSVRDYFAAKCLPAIYNDSLREPDWRDAVADAAYQLADAMLKAREKGAGS